MSAYIAYQREAFGEALGQELATPFPGLIVGLENTDPSDLRATQTESRDGN